MSSMIYQTRLNGLSVQIHRAQMMNEKDKVVFIWSPETGLPLNSKHKNKIESNCKWYISGQGVKNKLYPNNEDEKKAITLPSANNGKYVSIAQAVEGEF